MHRPSGVIAARGCTGFSLVELVIVVVIVGLLAAIAIPRFSAASENARFSAAKSALRNIREGIEMEHGLTGAYPTLRADFFQSNAAVSVNPYAPTNAQVFQQQAGLEITVTEPTGKVFVDGVDMAGWWYNPVSGAFRARIPGQGGLAANLAFYNRLNDTSLDLITRVKRSEVANLDAGGP